MSIHKNNRFRKEAPMKQIVEDVLSQTIANGFLAQAAAKLIMKELVD